jgi:hypothetical protein
MTRLEKILGIAGIALVMSVIVARVGAFISLHQEKFLVHPGVAVTAPPKQPMTIQELAEFLTSKGLEIEWVPSEHDPSSWYFLYDAQIARSTPTFSRHDLDASHFCFKDAYLGKHGIPFCFVVRRNTPEDAREDVAIQGGCYSFSFAWGCLAIYEIDNPRRRLAEDILKLSGLPYPGRKPSISMVVENETQATKPVPTASDPNDPFDDANEAKGRPISVR